MEPVEHFEKWNVSHKPVFTYLPVRQMKALILDGKRTQALDEYCRATGAGRVEAEGVVVAIEQGKSFQTPYGYVGWRTRGIRLYWCETCKTARQPVEIKREPVPASDWDDEIVYGDVCQVCKSETQEFHSDQFVKVLGQFADVAIDKVKLPTVYPERIAQGLTRSRLRQIAGKVHGTFLMGAFAPPEALEYESALVDCDSLLEFLVTKGHLDFDKVAEDVAHGKGLRDTGQSKPKRPVDWDWQELLIDFVNETNWEDTRKHFKLSYLDGFFFAWSEWHGNRMGEEDATEFEEVLKSKDTMQLISYLTGHRWLIG